MKTFEMYTVSSDQDFTLAGIAGLLDGINLSGCAHCGEEVGPGDSFNNFVIVLTADDGYAACEECYSPVLGSHM